MSKVEEKYPHLAYDRQTGDRIRDRTHCGFCGTLLKPRLDKIHRTTTKVYHKECWNKLLH